MKKTSPQKLVLSRATVRTLNAASLDAAGGMLPTHQWSDPRDTCTSEALSNCGACPWPTDPNSNRCTTW